MRTGVLDPSQFLLPVPPGPTAGTFLQEDGPVNYEWSLSTYHFPSSKTQLCSAASSSWDISHWDSLIRVPQKESSSQYMVHIDSRTPSCRYEYHRHELVLHSANLNHKLLLEPFLQPSEAQHPAKDLGAFLRPLTRHHAQFTSPSSDLASSHHRDNYGHQDLACPRSPLFPK